MIVNFDPAILSILEASRLPSDAAFGHVPAMKTDPVSMAAQLGPLWAGCSAISSQRRRAFIQLVAHHREVEPQRSRLNYLLGDRSLDQQAVEFVDDLATFHAYLSTVTIALIDRVKTVNGVLPSTEFQWAKKEDPLFWLMINGYGRPRHFPEIAGAFAHHAFEVENGRSEQTHFDDFEMV
jgi:hypothetical protein